MNKITPEYIDSVIDNVRYDLPESDSTLTICIMTLKNGTEIVGKSACCSVDIYDEFIGKQIARADAVRQIWPLEGYLLKERMLYQNGKREPETKAGHEDEPELKPAQTEEEMKEQIEERDTDDLPSLPSIKAEPETPEAIAEEVPGKITEITPTVDVIIESEPEPKIA